MSQAITQHMLHLMHHTLGLRPDRRIPFRNHYVTSPGHDEIPNLESLVEAGMMRRAHTPAFLNQDDTVFVCTDSGKSYAIEHLPPEPPKPKRSNYQDYIDADCGHSFADWMGINKPFYDSRRNGNKLEWRMRRRDRLYTWGSWGAVSGDWKPTKKAAKESYKAALAEFMRRSK